MFLQDNGFEKIYGKPSIQRERGTALTARSKEELIAELSDYVAGMDDEAVVSIAVEYVQAGYPALDGITEGLVDGMNRATALYNEGEYYVPELLVCSDAMYKGLEVLRPHLERRTLNEVRKVVIGVV